MIEFKSGVIKPQSWIICDAAERVFNRRHYVCIVTSLNDGKHKTNSKHYSDNAADFRTWHLPGGYLGDKAKQLTEELRAELGPGYDVLLEKDHIHAEYDPKTPADRMA